MKKQLCFVLTLIFMWGLVFSATPVAKGAVLESALGTMDLQEVEQPFETPTDLAVFGDGNGDGVINAKDALRTLRATVGKRTLTAHQVLVLDVNHDGKVNANDGLAILRHSVKKAPLQSITVKVKTIEREKYTANTPEAKVWRTQLATMKTTYGIQTQLEGVAAATAVNTVEKEVLAGKIMADVVEVSLAMSRTLARKKLLVNLRSSTVINGEWYENGGTEAVTVNGYQFGVALPMQSRQTLGIFYNEELIKRYAPQVDIEGLVAEKQWNFTAFRDLAKTCTVDTDEDDKTDLYGLVAGSHFLGMATYANAGGNALLVNGKVEVAFCNQNAINALYWAKTLFKEDRSWKYFADIRTCAETFGKGKAAMFACYSYADAEIAKTADFTMGFVPMPMGEAQRNYISPVFETPVYVVPLTATNRLVQGSLWLNAVANVSEGLLQVTRNRLAENGVNKAGQNHYEAMVRNATPDYGTGAFSANVVNTVERLTSLEEKEIAAVRAVSQQELDEFYGPLYE